MSGRVVLIAGASRGYGRRLAQAFWDAGASVCIISRDAVRLSDTAVAIDAGAGRLEMISADLAEPSVPHRVIDACLRRFGRLDAVIANAAIQGPIGSFESNDADDWERTIETNLLAPVRLARAALPALRKNPHGGAIIFLSGGGATAPRPNFSAYATAKAGIARFSETLAAELASAGITVNCIAPGPMPTAMTEAITAAGREVAGSNEIDAARNAAAKGEGAFSAAVDLALFLASPAGRTITGKLIAARWDRWWEWPTRAAELAASDAYTLRRITGRERGMAWGDA